MLARSREQGAEGLEERSRAPVRHPNQTAAEIEAQVLKLRAAHPKWGPRKLRWYWNGTGKPGRRRARWASCCGYPRDALGLAQGVMSACIVR